MNSFRIMYDMDFVDTHKNVSHKPHMTAEEKYDLRKVYTVYLTMYDLFLKYTEPDVDFSQLDDDYKKIYNIYSLQMLEKTEIKNKSIICNYKFHVDSIRRHMDEHFNKKIKTMLENDSDNDSEVDIDNESKNININVTSSTPSNSHLYYLSIPIIPAILINLFCINTILFFKIIRRRPQIIMG